MTLMTKKQQQWYNLFTGFGILQIPASPNMEETWKESENVLLSKL